MEDGGLMPNRLFKRAPGEAPRPNNADSVDYLHTCNDCGWERDDRRRGSSGKSLAFEHAKRLDHRTTMIVTRYYEYEGRYA